MEYVKIIFLKKLKNKEIEYYRINMFTTFRKTDLYS